MKQWCLDHPFLTVLIVFIFVTNVTHIIWTILALAAIFVLLATADKNYKK